MVAFNRMGEDALAGRWPAVARRALEMRCLAVKDEDVLWVGDIRGDIQPEWLPSVNGPTLDTTLASVRQGALPGAGMYHRGQRILSCCVLAVEGETLPPPAAAETMTYETLLAFPELRGRRDDLSAFRAFVADGRTLQQWITLESQSLRASSVRLTLTLACDDMLCDDGASGNLGAMSYLDGATLHLAWHDANGTVRHTDVVFDRAPLDVHWLGAYDLAGVPPRVAVSFHVYPVLAEPAVLGVRIAPADELAGPQVEGFAMRAPAVDPRSAAAAVRDRHARALLDGALYDAHQPALDATLRRAAADLRLLMSRADSGDTLSLASLLDRPAPPTWDALIASFQSLALNPTYAASTLRALAPSIVHALDTTDAAAEDSAWHTVESAPLWVALLCDWLDWTGDLQMFNALLPAARGTMGTIGRHLDCRGYLRVAGRDEIRLEAQVYTCLARRSLARALRRCVTPSDSAEIATLERDAEVLRQQIERDFWLPTEGCYARSLSDAWRSLADVTSASAHALWARVAAGPRAARLATRLTQPDLASGWGLRSRSTAHPDDDALDPSGGAVRTHETAFAASGLLRTGRGGAGLSLARGVFDLAAAQLDARLPAYVGGQQREGLYESEPCWCADASLPCAAAAASPIALAAAMLGLQPDALARRLTLRPVLPEWLPRLTVRHLRVGAATVDLDVTRVGMEGACEVSAQVTSGECQVLVRPPARIYA